MKNADLKGRGKGVVGYTRETKQGTFLFRHAMNEPKRALPQPLPCKRTRADRQSRVRTHPPAEVTKLRPWTDRYNPIQIPWIGGSSKESLRLGPASKNTKVYSPH